MHLSFNMRSIDFGLGIPFNIASYALLLHLLCKETNFEEGILTGFLSNCHIYENQITAIEEQLKREPYNLPRIETPKFESIFTWEYTDTNLLNYNFHNSIKMPIAV
jgi:thymidylate synthase